MRNVTRSAFAFCLIYSSAAIFKKVGVDALLVYCVLTVVAVWWSTTRFFPWLRAQPAQPWAYALVAAALFVGVLTLYLYAHPRIDTAGFRIGSISIGASDNDDAIDVAIDELRAGRYPYYPRTFLNGPLSPLPGALLLALPFYLVGDSALQNVFWIAVFFWLRMRSMRAASRYSGSPFVRSGLEIMRNRGCGGSEASGNAHRSTPEPATTRMRARAGSTAPHAARSSRSCGFCTSTASQR